MNCIPSVFSISAVKKSLLLFSDVGQVIFIYGAYYGRTDQTTCSYKRPSSQTENVDCSQRAIQAAERYNSQLTPLLQL